MLMTQSMLILIDKRNSLKVLSKKCTSITKDSKLSRNES